MKSRGGSCWWTHDISSMFDMAEDIFMFDVFASCSLFSFLAIFPSFSQALRFLASASVLHDVLRTTQLLQLFLSRFLCFEPL